MLFLAALRDAVGRLMNIMRRDETISSLLGHVGVKGQLTRTRCRELVGPRTRPRLGAAALGRVIILQLTTGEER